MKANEAPKKLYLHPTAKGNVGASWLTFPLTDNDIEYTRTDAFIEKAAGFICECIEDCMARYMETWSPEMKAKTIDNFKNYMKQ